MKQPGVRAEYSLLHPKWCVESWKYMAGPSPLSWVFLVLYEYLYIVLIGTPEDIVGPGFGGVVLSGIFRI